MLFSLLYVQCILEAQIPVQHESIFHDKIPSLLLAPLLILKSPLDAYALGYCISISGTRIPWKVDIGGDMGPYFIAGLKNNKCSGGAACIQDLRISAYDLHIDAEWEVLFALDALVSLEFRNYNSNQAAHLVELIPLMTNLQKLVIIGYLNEGNSYWIKVLHQLSMTNVCNLKFGVFSDDLAPNLYDDYCSALRRLIHPCTGKLEELVICTKTYNDKLLRVLSGESSLKSLTLSLVMAPRTDSTYFKHNTCLNTLTIRDEDWSASTHISEVIKCNTTLQHLKFGPLRNLDGLELIAQALHENTTLQEVTIRAGEYYKDGYDKDGIIEPRPAFLTDPRVLWKC